MKNSYLAYYLSPAFYTRTKTINNLEEFDKVNFFSGEESGKVKEKSKIKKLLAILILVFFVFLTGCRVSDGELTKTNYNSTKVSVNKNRKPKEKSPKPTARCRDGWISYSGSRKGTCSKHKGVDEWLR